MREHKNIIIGEKTKLYRYTPKNKNEVLLFTAKRTGFLEIKKGYVLQREDYNSYCLSVTVSGNGTLIYNDKTYNVSKGSVMFFDQNQKHVLKNDGNDNWQHYYVYFWGSQVSEFYKVFKQNFNNVTNLINGQYLIDTIKKIHVLITSSFVDETEISYLIYGLLLYLYKQCKNNKLRKEHNPAIEAEMYIQEHYKEHITLDKIAEYTNSGKYYLSHIYKEVWGTSIIKHLINIRFEKCLLSLIKTDDNINYILESNNFNNKHLFIKMCKAHTGMTPSQYREKMKQNV